MKGLIVVVASCLLLIGCKDVPKPKPDGFLALDFPPKHYKTLGGDCPYSFKINKITQVKKAKTQALCDININYPKMKGTIYITYEPVHDNLKKLLEDAQELPLKHAIKADEIKGDQYSNDNHDTYGMLYTVTGNAASQAQFYLTDSTEHFLTGSVYFKMEPNYDSIYPAAEYVKKDMKTIMESTEWDD